MNLPQTLRTLRDLDAAVPVACVRRDKVPEEVMQMLGHLLTVAECALCQVPIVYGPQTRTVVGRFRTVLICGEHVDGLVDFARRHGVPTVTGLTSGTCVEASDHLVQ